MSFFWSWTWWKLPKRVSLSVRERKLCRQRIGKVIHSCVYTRPGSVPECRLSGQALLLQKQFRELPSHRASVLNSFQVLWMLSVSVSITCMQFTFPCWRHSDVYKVWFLGMGEHHESTSGLKMMLIYEIKHLQWLQIGVLCIFFFWCCICYMCYVTGISYHFPGIVLCQFSVNVAYVSKVGLEFKVKRSSGVTNFEMINSSSNVSNAKFQWLDVLLTKWWQSLVLGIAIT